MTHHTASDHIRIKRAYEEPAATDGYRILIDRLWPRGIKKEALKLSEWNRDLAPSNELRKWFGHEPARYAEFRKRYIAELQDQAETIRALAQRARDEVVTVVFAAHDEEHNNAVVMRELLLDPSLLGHED